MTATRDDLVAQLKKFDDDVKQEGGERLAALDKRIAALKPKALPADKRPEFGYHSQTSATSDVEKWVEVDLGRDVNIAKIVLHPCHDNFGGIGAGFGFPVRFRVDARPDAKLQQQAVGLETFVEKDFPNPGLSTVELSGDGTSARFVRITATKLADRKGVFIFALAELEIL
ncbi:MAG: cytochrome C, partial [Fuerstiella sp.]